MLNIPQKYKSLKFIRPIQWVEIFDTWRKGEASQESWKKHWEERGFDSWDEWRTVYAEPLNPGKLEWFLYSFKDPIKDLPFIYGTPTHSWIDKAYKGEKTMQFADIVKLPIIAENDKVAAVKNNFPKETILTGIIYTDKIILIEGMHRACALANWDKENQLNGEVKIALASWNKEIPALGGNYKKSWKGNPKNQKI